MNKITLYCSHNEQFIFDTAKECQHYDSFGVITFEELFLEIEGINFVLLEVTVDEKHKKMQALLQALEVYLSDDLCSNNDTLWKITYDFSKKYVTFQKKDGTYVTIFCDIDHESANAKGWFPFWQDTFIVQDDSLPSEFTEKAFLTYIKESFINYYTAFGCINEIV